MTETFEAFAERVKYVEPTMALRFKAGVLQQAFKITKPRDTSADDSGVTFEWRDVPSED